jgi:hypothetical protein
MYSAATARCFILRKGRQEEPQELLYVFSLQYRLIRQSWQLLLSLSLFSLANCFPSAQQKARPTREIFVGGDFRLLLFAPAARGLEDFRRFRWLAEFILS